MLNRTHYHYETSETILKKRRPQKAVQYFKSIYWLAAVTGYCSYVFYIGASKQILSVHYVQTIQLSSVNYIHKMSVSGLHAIFRLPECQNNDGVSLLLRAHNGFDVLLWVCFSRRHQLCCSRQEH